MPPSATTAAAVVVEAPSEKEEEEEEEEVVVAKKPTTSLPIPVNPLHPPPTPPPPTNHPPHPQLITLPAPPHPLPPSTATTLLTALRTSGFLYLSNHPIPPTLLARVFALSAQFFALPQRRKDALAWTTARANRGYVCLGREKVSQALTSAEVAREREGAGEDLKESFEVGREGGVGGANRWPEEEEGQGQEGGFDARGFRETMQEFFERGKELHRVVMRGVAMALGLEAGFFDGFVGAGDNTLRLLHYPPVPKRVFQEGRVRAGAHSDYGSVTLLFQDTRGGLQVEDPGGEEGWVDVGPREGCVVVNAGDLLARWSNGLVRSTKHRVVEPPLVGGRGGRGGAAGGDVVPARYSVAYFCNPDFDRWIEALPGTYGGERGGKRWEGINSGEYLEQRLSATY